MVPPPRDFTSAQFKFGWVIDGLPPDDELTRIVQGGLHGTAMLPWRVPDVALDAILQHVKTFDREAWTATALGTRVELSADPWGDAREEEAITRGQIVYHGVAQCYACHPAYISRGESSAARGGAGDIRADLHESAILRSDHRRGGEPLMIRAPDFTWDALRSVREASTREDLYRVIAAGIPGTAMPTWQGALASADLWALAWYVESLTRLRDRPEGQLLRERLRRADPSASAAGEPGGSRTPPAASAGDLDPSAPVTPPPAPSATSLPAR